MDPADRDRPRSPETSGVRQDWRVMVLLVLMALGAATLLVLLSLWAR